MTAVGYVACPGDEAVVVVAFDDHGRPEVTGRRDALGNVRFLARDEARGHLLAVSKGATNSVVRAFELLDDASIGAEIWSAELGHTSTHLAYSAAANCVFSASYDSGCVDTVWLDDVGAVRSVETGALHPGANAHCVLPFNGGADILVTSLGTDALVAYRWSASGWSEQARLQVPDHTGPRHVVVSEDERFAYVVGELSGEVFSVALERLDDGELSIVGSARDACLDDLAPGIIRTPERADYPADAMWASDILLTGSTLVVSERSQGWICRYDVDSITGALDARGGFRTHAQARGIAVVEGNLVVCDERTGEMRVCESLRSTSIYTIPVGAGALQMLTSACA